MANPLLTMARSAMPERVKRTALTQQALKIMKNTSQELPEDLKTQLLSEFSGRMRASGYRARYWLEIIKSAMTAFDKMREEQEHGGRLINRPRSYQRETRKKKKISAKSEWYKAVGYSTVMFVPATPHGKLANMLRESERKMAQERGWRIKIVERGGQRISSRLVKDPWTGPCDKDECLVCRSAETMSDRKNSGPCTRNGCCYRIECRNCREKGPDTLPPNATDDRIAIGNPMVSYYIGETARNSHTRSIEHQEAVKTLQANNALGKHALEYHDGREITLDMWVTSIHKDPLTRQIQEGVSIVAGGKHKRDSELPHLLLNSKTEYLQGVVPQTRTTRGSIS